MMLTERELVGRSLLAMYRMKSLSAVLAFLCACSTPAATERAEALCEEFRAHLNQPTRLSAFAIAGATTDDDTERLPNIDFDSDGVVDRVVRFCPSSASTIPADPCTLEAQSSAMGKTFVIEEQRLYLIQFKSSFYVVAGKMNDESGPMATDIYLLTRTGMQRICSYECDPKSDCKRTVR